MDDDELFRLVTTARPPSPATHPAVTRSLADLNRAVAVGASSGASAVRSVGSPRRGRRRSSRIAVLALAATLATGTAAAAAVHAARTGWFTAAGSESDTTQWLDTTASDYPRVVAGLAPRYVTYAPGSGAHEAARWVVASTRSSGGLVQETGVARSYATYGQCSWLAAWQGSRAGAPAHSDAARALTAAASWRVFATTDGGGVVDAMNDLAAAATAEDSARVDELAPLACPADLVGPR